MEFILSGVGSICCPYDTTDQNGKADTTYTAPDEEGTATLTVMYTFQTYEETGTEVYQDPVYGIDILIQKYEERTHIASGFVTIVVGETWKLEVRLSWVWDETRYDGYTRGEVEMVWNFAGIRLVSSDPVTYLSYTASGSGTYWEERFTQEEDYWWRQTSESEASQQMSMDIGRRGNTIYISDILALAGTCTGTVTTIEHIPDDVPIEEKSTWSGTWTMTETHILDRSTDEPVEIEIVDGHAHLKWEWGIEESLLTFEFYFSVEEGS